MTKDMACITFTAGRPCLEEEPANRTRDMLEGGRDDLFKCLIRGHKAQVKRERTLAWITVTAGRPCLEERTFEEEMQLRQETCLKEEDMTSSNA